MSFNKVLRSVAIVLLGVILTGCSLFGGQPSPKPAGQPTPVSPNSPPPEITGTISTGQTVTAATETVAASGGTIKVTQPGSPLTGLEIKVPAKAYSDTRQYRVTYAPVEKHTFGDNFNPVSPLITVDNGGGYSNEFMSVKIPVKVAEGQFAMGFLFDDTTGKLEGLPLVAKDSSSITVATRHFSRIVASSIDINKLVNKNIPSGFTPGVDDWQFVNYGSYIAPDGHCAGQSISALWYYSQRPDGKTVTLNGRYDNNGAQPSSPGYQWDDSFTYRFVSVVQEDIDWTSTENKYWDGLIGINDEDTWKLFAYTIQQTREPQLVIIYNKDSSTGHAIIAYRVDQQGRIYVADPNYPGKSDRVIEFKDGKFKPYNSGANARAIATGNETSYEKIGYFAKTTTVDWDKIKQRWAQVKDKSIGNVGNNKFPDYELEVRDLNNGQELKDGDTSTGKLVGIVTNSKTAKLKLQVFINGVETKGDGRGNFELKPGNNIFGIRIDGQDKTLAFIVDNENENMYIDFKYINVKYNPPTTTAAPSKLIYKLTGSPVINKVTSPSASGASATLSGTSATYTSPDPNLLKVTQTVAWDVPTTIDPTQSYSISFKSNVAVAQAQMITQHIPKTGVESWQQARDVTTYPSVTSNPTFRIVTTFSLGTAAETVQYSPDGGKTWRPTMTANDAWQNYYLATTTQVWQPIGLWSKHIGQYSPPSASKPLPLSTPVSETLLPFRARPDFLNVNGTWPDQFTIVIRAEATGLSGSSGGASLGTVIFTYKKQ